MLEIKTDYDNITIKVDSGTAPLLGVMAVGAMLPDAIQHQVFKAKEKVNDRIDPFDLSDH